MGKTEIGQGQHDILTNVDNIVPSLTVTFQRSRFLLQNTNSAPSNGSRLKLLSTIIDKPLIDFLMSVCPHARYTRLPSNLSMAASPPVATLPTYLPDIHHLRLSVLWQLQCKSAFRELLSPTAMRYDLTISLP